MSKNKSQTALLALDQEWEALVASCELEEAKMLDGLRDAEHARCWGYPPLRTRKEVWEAWMRFLNVHKQAEKAWWKRYKALC